MDESQVGAAALHQAEPGAVALDQRIAEAKASLGTNYVLHPAYRGNPRHSLNPDIYGPARAMFLASIASNALADRQRNPMWHLANRMRSAAQAPLPPAESGPAFLRRVVG